MSDLPQRFIVSKARTRWCPNESCKLLNRGGGKWKLDACWSGQHMARSRPEITVTWPGSRDEGGGDKQGGASVVIRGSFRWSLCCNWPGMKGGHTMRCCGVNTEETDCTPPLSYRDHGNPGRRDLTPNIRTRSSPIQTPLTLIIKYCKRCLALT